MTARSLRTRGVNFAYLFGPPRFIRREEAYAVHGEVCRALGCDDLSFQYLNPEAARPDTQAFQLQFQKKEGRGALTVTLDNPGMKAPIRLLVGYTWPPSMEHVYETMDSTCTSVFGSLQGQWQKVLAEVRIRAQCEARGNDGLRFMKEGMLRPRPDWLQALGDPSLISVRFMVPASTFQTPMDNPHRELVMEVLKEDPRGLYIELMTQWPQLSEIPPPSPDTEVRIRTIEASPREYIEEAHEFLQGRLAELEG